MRGVFFQTPVQADGVLILPNPFAELIPAVDQGFVGEFDGGAGSPGHPFTLSPGHRFTRNEELFLGDEPVEQGRVGVLEERGFGDAAGDGGRRSRRTGRAGGRCAGRWFAALR